MKRVLLLITLTMFTFMAGYAQFDITTQTGYDAQMEEIFGQPTVSEDLDVLNFSSMMKGNRGDEWIGYGSFIPASGSYSGKLYKIDFASGTTTVVKNYPSYYFTSAEYVEDVVYVFCNNFTKGFGKLDPTTGAFTSLAKIKKGMTDLTYNHNNETLYGLNYGKIYSINLENGTPTQVYKGSMNFIAIACTTDGTMYAVTQSSSANAKLYKFTGNDFSSDPTFVNDLNYPTQYTQSMAYDHNTDRLVWWQNCKNGKHIVELDLDGNEVNSTSTSTSMGGLYFKFSNKEHDVTLADMTGGSATVNPTSAKKGATITVTVTPEGCNEIASVTTTPELTVTEGTEGVYTFAMPAEDVEVSVTFTVHPTITSVTLAADKQVLCFGNEATLTATVEGGSNNTYSWYKDEGLVEETTENTYSADAGSWYVKVKSEHGCELSSAAVAVYVDPSEVDKPVIDGNSEVCPGGNLELSLKDWQGSDELNIIWKNGETTLFEGTNMTEITIENVTAAMSITATAVGTFEVEGVGSVNCEETSDAFAVALKSLTIEITGAKAACSDSEDITLTATAGYESYEWSSNPSGIEFGVEDNEATFHAPAVETTTVYTITVTGTDADGCSVSAEHELTVNALPVVVAADSLVQVCYGGTFTLNVKDADENTYDYQWYYDGNPVGAAGTTYTKENAQVEDDGFYTVKATHKTLGCVGESEEVTVNVLQLPEVPGIEGPTDPICYEATAELSFDYSYEPDEYTFTWYQKVEGEWVEKGNGVTYTTESLTENTEFLLKARYTWAQLEGGCTVESEPFTVSVKPNTPVEVVAKDGDDLLIKEGEHYNSCVGNGYKLEAIGSFETYKWLKHNGTEYVEIAGATASTYEETEAVSTADVTNMYQVKVTDEGGCEFHGEVAVKVNALPEVAITEGETITVCVGVETTINATGADTYTWGGDFGESTGETFTFTATEEGTYAIGVAGVNATTNCETTASIEVIVNPLPVVEITSPEAKEYNMIEGEIALTATPAGGTFTLDDETFTESTIDLMLLAEDSHTVVYTYTDENGCENSATVTFTIASKEYWSDSDNYDDAWYLNPTEPDRYEITDAAQLGYFFYLLENNVDNFENKYIQLTDDIDLAGKFVKPFTGFKGVLEGYGKQVKNLTMCEETTVPWAINLVNEGVVRNIGVIDAKIYATATNGINFINYGTIRNSYMIGSTVRVMGDGTYNIKNADGAYLQNFYLLNNKVFDEATLKVVNNGTMDHEYSKPGVNFSGIVIPEFTGDKAALRDALNTWVDEINTADNIDWRTVDDIDYPIHEEFLHMVHYNVNLLHVLGGEGSIERSNMEDGHDIVKERGKEYGWGGDHIAIDTTFYGFAGDTVTVTVTFGATDYCRLDSINVVTKHGVEVESYEVGDYVYFCMPFDTLDIKTNISKDYWTDYAEFDWYSGAAASNYEIQTPQDLAGLACIVNGINLPQDINKNDFSGKYVAINATDIDLTGHMWRPIDGFKGTLEGMGHTISNMRTIDDMAGLFASLGSGAVVRNLGVTDAYAETTAEGAVDGAAILAVNNAGSILNCYVNNVEVKGAANTAVAVASNVAGAQVKNVYAAQVIKADATQFIAANAGSYAGNYAEFTTTEPEANVKTFTVSDKETLTGWLNSWVSGTTNPAYYMWNNKSGENDDYPVFVEDKAYYITYKKAANGTTTGVAFANAGEEVEVTVTPAEGYELNSLTYAYYDDGCEYETDIEELKKFKMPAFNVEVRSSFKATNYYITYTPSMESPVNGCYIGGDANGNIGDAIVVNVTEAPGYELISLFTVIGTDTTDIFDNREFTMPAANVAVVATFDGLEHNITVENPENGTITTDPANKARYTHEVTITVTPNNGYVVDEIFVTETGGTGTVEVVDGKFTMPNFGVTVTATLNEGYWTDADIRDITWYVPGTTSYDITTANELGGLSYLVNDLDKTGKPVNFDGVTFNINNDIDMSTYKWRPIGGQVKTTYTFKGNIEGNGYAITGMTVEKEGGSYQSFVGVNEGRINNVNIQGTSEGKYWTAGLVGKNSGTITNCVSNVYVKSVYEAAGIAANNIGTIENCYNRGMIENTSAAGPIKASLNFGGIAAVNTGKIKNVYNVGVIAGSGHSQGYYAGAIVGKNTTAANVINAYWLDTMEKGVGTGKIDASCHTFTSEYGQAEGEESLVAELNTYTSGKDNLLNWENGTGDYLYPVFEQPAKGEEFNDIADVTEGNINLYPNPAKEYVKIECEGIQRVKVVNVTGQIVIDQDYDTNNVQLDTHNLTPGMYTVNIVTENGTFSRNVVIMR